MHIPDYLIYDELKRRRQREREDEEATSRRHLELPLYRPEPPRRAPSLHEDDPPERDRGVMIIDLNDLLDDDD